MSIEEIKKEDFDEQEYLKNLHFLLGEMSEDKWMVLLVILQSKINHERIIAFHAGEAKGRADVIKNDD